MRRYLLAWNYRALLVGALLLGGFPAVAQAGISAPCGLAPTADCIMRTYNVVVGNGTAGTGNVSTGSDIEGSSVIGGNLSGATFFNNAVRMPAQPQILLYGRLTDSININGGGSIAYGSLGRNGKITLNGGGTMTKGGWPTAFSAFSTALNAKSAQLATIADDATLSLDNNAHQIQVNGISASLLKANNGIAYVTIAANNLVSLLTGFTGTAPTLALGAGVNSAVINVTGTPVSGTDLGAGLNMSNNIYQNILFNFTNATTLQLNSWSTAVLAPNASVTLHGSAFDGFIYADNLSSSAEIHNYYYTGGVRVPEPGTLALLAAGLAAIFAVRRGRRMPSRG